MNAAIHTAQDDLSDALSLVTDERQRVCVRHAINRLERAYREEIWRQQDLAVRAAIRERDTLPAPAADTSESGHSCRWSAPSRTSRKRSSCGTATGADRRWVGRLGAIRGRREAL